MYFYHDSVQFEMHVLLAFRSVCLLFLVEVSYYIAAFCEILSADINVNISAAATFGFGVVLGYSLTFEEYRRDVLCVEGFDDLIECGVEEIVHLLDLDADHHKFDHDLLGWPQFLGKGFDSVSYNHLYGLLCCYAQYGFPVYAFLKKGSVCCFAP